MRTLLIAAAMLVSCAACGAPEMVRLDFGELRPESEVTRRIRLEHTGTNNLLVAKIVASAGVDAALTRQVIESNSQISLNVTLKTAKGSGDIAGSIEIWEAGNNSLWTLVAITGWVVDGEKGASVVEGEGAREVWHCPADVDTISTRKMPEGGWMATYERTLEVLKDSHASSSEKYIAQRLASIAAQEAYDASGDEDVPEFKIFEGYDFFKYCDEDAKAAKKRYEKRVSDRKGAEFAAKLDAERAERRREMEERRAKAKLEQEERRKARDEMIAASKRAEEERKAAAERARAEKEAGAQALRDRVKWTPPEYFTEEFATNTFLGFLETELRIPGPDKKGRDFGREYREMLAIGFMAYSRESANPFAEACDAMKAAGVKKIDPRSRAGWRFSCCFTWIFGSGDRGALKVDCKDGETRMMIANDAVVETAWDGRKGELYRLLGKMYRPLYYSGKDHSESMLKKHIESGEFAKGVEYALDWCRDLAKENPADDTWQRCAYPILRGVFALCDTERDDFVAKLGEMLGEDAFLVNAFALQKKGE